MSKLRTNVFYNALLISSNLILPFITFPYVTRVLAPEGIGQVNFATSFIQYFVIISSLGIPFYGIREIAKTRDNVGLRSKIFLELFIIKLICSIFALIIYLFLVFSIPKFNNSLPFYLYGIGTILIGIFDFNYFFSALENFKYITVRTICFQIISVISIFVFIKTKEDALKYFIIPIIISLLIAVVNSRYILHLLSFSVIEGKLELRRHLSPLFLLFSIMLVTSIYNLLDSTILGFLAENVYVGYYAVASKINRIPLSLIMVLAPVMLPRISVEFNNENFTEIKRLLSKTIQFVVLIGVPVMVGLFLTAPEVITLISGREFTPAIDTLRIMSPISLIIGITTIFSIQLLIPMGKDKQLLYAVMYGTGISLLLNFILIPILQHNGAAISNLVAEIVVLITCYIFASPYMHILIPYKQIISTLISCLPFAIIIFVTRQLISSPLLILLTTIVISAFYYFTVQIFLFKNIVLIEFKEAVINKVQSML